jgi:predicted MPP superfamily phosphohydrolase
VGGISAEQPDVGGFTGDLQNVDPQEIAEHLSTLSQLKAKNGVYSVLGNHDYDKYLLQKDGLDTQPCRETIALEKRMGWHLLQNENCTIKRGNDSLTIAGLDNDGDGKRFPQRGDVKKALQGATPFVIMLEHDPSGWRRKILPDGRAQLTLSGHTHNMQFALFGWAPMKLTGREINGWYKEGRQSLFVTAGLGGLIPFRFGATGEIVVLELKNATCKN